MKFRLKKSIYLLLATMLVMASVLTGCGSDSSGKAAESTVSLSIVAKEEADAMRQKDEEAPEAASSETVSEEDAGSAAELEAAADSKSDAASAEQAAGSESDPVSGEATADSKSDTADAAASDKADDQADSTAAAAEEDAEDSVDSVDADPSVAENGTYTTRDEVALYIHLYGHLPSNFITKKKAEKLGWDSHAGNLWDVAPGMSIGGSRFGNYEGQLPEGKNRSYYECDIDFDGGYRGAKRIIYSDDGLIFYTDDHYKTFTQLY